MNQYLQKIKNMDIKFIIECIIILILLPGIIRGMFYVGHEVGITISSWF